MPVHHASGRFAVAEFQPVEPLRRARLHQAPRPADAAVRLALQPSQARDDDEALLWLPDHDAAAPPDHAAPDSMPGGPGSGSSMMPAAPAVTEPVVPAAQVFSSSDASGALVKGMLGTIAGAAPTMAAVAGLAATAGTMVWAVDHRSETLQPSKAVRADDGADELAQTMGKPAVSAQWSGLLSPAGNQATDPVGMVSVDDQVKNDQLPDDLPVHENGSKTGAVVARPEGLPATTDKVGEAGHAGTDTTEQSGTASMTDPVVTPENLAPNTNTAPVADGVTSQTLAGSKAEAGTGHATDASHAGQDENAGSAGDAANASNAAGAGANAASDGDAGQTGSAGAGQGDAPGAADAGGGLNPPSSATDAQPDAAGSDPADTGSQSAQAQANTLRQIPSHLFQYYSEAFLGDGNTIPYLQITRIVEHQDENGVIDALRLGGRDEPLKVGDLIAAADYDKVFWDGASNQGGVIALAPIKEDRTPYIDGYYSEFDIASIKGLPVSGGHAGSLPGSMALLLEVPPDQQPWIAG